MSAATATLPSPPGTSLGAAVNGPDGCRPPGFANAATLPHPSPSTAPVRPGLVPQCGQEPGTWGDTPRPVALSHSGRRRAVLTSRWPWASDGPFAERRIVGPCRHWRSRRTLSGGGPSRRLPLTDRCRRRIPSGPGGSAARPACAPSAGRAQWAGSPAARGCVGRRDTGPGAVNQLSDAPPGCDPRTAIAQRSRARWPARPGLTRRQVACSRAACLAAHQAAQPVAR